MSKCLLFLYSYQVFVKYNKRKEPCHFINKDVHVMTSIAKAQPVHKLYTPFLMIQMFLLPSETKVFCESAE